MDADEMIEILEELIRDPDTNPTAKCTAIRTLREIAPEPPKAGAMYALDEFRPLRRKRAQAPKS